MVIIEPKTTDRTVGSTTFKYFNTVLSTNVTSSLAPEWVSGKSDYAIDEVIYNPVLQREYTCGVTGSLAIPWESSEWLDLGAENNAKMHDQTLFTKTESVVDIVVEYQTLYENMITFFGLSGIVSITIEQRTLDTDTLIRSTVENLVDYGCDNFVEYCYTEAFFKNNFAYKLEGDRPAKIIVTFRGSTLKREIGAVLLGNIIDYGCVFTGTEVITDNLAKFTDNGLVTYFVGKGVVKTLKGEVKIPSNRAEFMDKKLDELSSSLAVYWLNDDDNLKEMGMVLGYPMGHSFKANGQKYKKIPFKIIGIK